MVELKPRLTQARSRESDSGNFTVIMLLLIAFIIGVFIAIKIDDVNVYYIVRHGQRTINHKIDTGIYSRSSGHEGSEIVDGTVTEEISAIQEGDEYDSPARIDSR